MSPALAGGFFFTTEPTGKPEHTRNSSFVFLKLSKKNFSNIFNLLWTQKAACIVQFIHFSIAQIYVICNFPLFQTILLWTFLCNTLVYIFESFFMIYLTRNCWALRCTSQSVSSVTQSCPTLCDSMDCSTPGFPVHHQLPEVPQTHVHHVADVIQPAYPLLSPSPAFNLSQHQGLFKWVSSSHQVAKVLEFQL